MKTIKLYQAKSLIYQHSIDDLIYVDKVSVEGCTDIIFKSNLSDQLYSFYYYFYSDGSNSGLATNTKQSNAFLDDINNRDLDVEVAPVKKLLVTSYDYVRDDSND